MASHSVAVGSVLFWRRCSEQHCSHRSQGQCLDSVLRGRHNSGGGEVNESLAELMVAELRLQEEELLKEEREMMLAFTRAYVAEAKVNALRELSEMDYDQLKNKANAYGRPSKPRRKSPP